MYTLAKESVQIEQIFTRLAVQSAHVTHHIRMCKRIYYCIIRLQSGQLYVHKCILLKQGTSLVKCHLCLCQTRQLEDKSTHGVGMVQWVCMVVGYVQYK